ncbi:MAG TPA: M20/M25/M40 family metallo-hydrolase [Longimicrobiaceae bacterium]|nr:M20/M25/M40 family metallo-hydrolase [Longimicrobiaceae bacterium]
MQFERLWSHPRVERARTLLREHDAETLDEQMRLAAIEAPSGAERARGEYVQRRFRELGLTAVGSDEVGNVLGTLARDGGERGGEAPIVVAAHLDTIFPAGTEIQVRREGSRISAPGITDNARGLAAMLGVIRAIREAEITTERPVLFVASVGEEGIGDLLGMKHLFREGATLRAAPAFITLDGAGLTRIVHQAIGACRLKATISGVGGHSWGDRGVPNPVHALGLAVARLREVVPEGRGDFGVSVGRIGGGTSVNAIPSEAWIELDLRSDDDATLTELEQKARSVLEEAVREEKEDANRPAPLALRIEVIGSRPSGATPADADVVRATIEATRFVGVGPELTASSTDANVPISLGIPSVAIGAGGVGGGVHTNGEWYENEGGVLGTERALLSLLAIAGVADPPQAD